MHAFSNLFLVGTLLVSFMPTSTTADEAGCTDLPDLRTLLELAFPVWNVNEAGERVEGGGPWNPLYYTKKYDGLDPQLGGYPTDIDVGYPFYYPAPFLGQPGAGTPHHCPENSPNDIRIQSCPKVETTSDHGPNGPGHIPPPITLAAVRQTYRDDCPSVEELQGWFDYDHYQCLITPETLLGMVRRYYPRDPDTGKVEYPSAADPNSSAYYELEFPGPQGGAHWCSDEFVQVDHWADFCPYVYEGENAGKYQHPHISLVAVQQYLANLVMPDKCGTEWKSIKGEYPEGPARDTSIVFPQMASEDWWAQPKLPYKWPETPDRKRKTPLGTFPLYLVVQDDFECDIAVASSSTSTTDESSDGLRLGTGLMAMIFITAIGVYK